MPINIPAILKPVTGGIIYTLRFIIKHWYVWILLLSILPAIFSSISVARETKNYAYPFLALGIHLTNADAMIRKDVDILNEDPYKLIGALKPEIGIYAKFKYWGWYIPKLIWKFLGNIFLISVPFVFFYKLFRWRGSKGLQSSKSADLTKAFIWGMIFVFLINLVILTHSAIAGNTLLIIPENMDIYEESWFIIKNSMPFHGLYKLGGYLMNLY